MERGLVGARVAGFVIFRPARCAPAVLPHRD